MCDPISIGATLIGKGVSDRNKRNRDDRHRQEQRALAKNRRDRIRQKRDNKIAGQRTSNIRNFRSAVSAAGRNRKKQSETLSNPNTTTNIGA